MNFTLALSTLLPMALGLTFVGATALLDRLTGRASSLVNAARLKKRLRRLSGAALLVLIPFLAAATTLQVGAWRRTEAFTGPFVRTGISKSDIWMVKVGRDLPFSSILSTGGDMVDHWSQSDLQFAINGVRLMHPHSAHVDILSQNPDNFSHWIDEVYFSLPSDVPNDGNVRTQVTYTVRLKPSAFWLLGAAIAVTTLLFLAAFGGGGLFVGAQVVLIYVCGLGSLAGIAIVTALIAAIAVYLGPGRRGGPAGLWFGCFVLYWLIQKYVVPLIGVDQFGSNLAASGAGSVLEMVGISYMGFKLIHFLVDREAGAIGRLDPLEFMGWLFFFPSIIAGPMQRYEDWCQQRAACRVTVADVLSGVNSVLSGLVLKFVLADTIHGGSLPMMTDGVLAEASLVDISGAAALYSFYLYWDFAGYSRIAIGIGRFWGIRLPENFNYPFIARNLAEFWKRWHISLSELLRDYLYYPLALRIRRFPISKRVPNLAAFLPPLATFILAGVWHGAGIGYLIYGLIHGIGLGYLAVAARSKARTGLGRWWAASPIGYCFGMTINFCYVTLSFVFFSLDHARLAILARRFLE